MEPRAKSMRRALSLRRGAARSAARGDALTKAMGRAKMGGENEDDDIEMGGKEQQRQDIDAMEQGRSPSPPTNYNPPTPSLSSMEKGFGTQKKGEVYYNPNAYLNVGGKRRRRSKKFYKGKASKTRKGRKDFITHKGDKYFNRKGHRQTKRQGKSKSLFEQLFGL